MDPMFRPKTSATGQPSQPSNDDFMYRMIPSQLKKTPSTQMTRQAAMRVGSPVGSPQNNEWVDRVNSSSNEQLDQFFDKQTIPYYQNRFKANQQFRSSAPIAVSQGSSLRPNQESYRTGAAQTSGGVRQSSQGTGFQSLMPRVQSPALAQSAWPIQNQYVRTGLAQASPQQVDRSSPAWQQQFGQSFGDAMQADRQRQIDYANQRVDSRLAASQGNYPTPENRRAGFFGRGWDTSMPQPQELRQMTFNPAQSAEANRALFSQHTDSMQNNPAYSQRVNAERAARRGQLADRDAIANARRQGAIEAAGSGQQLRNLMAGRGALGPGRDGFGALMSLAAMRNPNEAFDGFGQAFVGLNAPGMQTERLGAEGRMLDQNLGAQERMLGQNLGSNERVASLHRQALSAEQDAQRAFMASQNALDFRQKKELEDLAYQRQRESDTFNARLQIMLGEENPYRAKMMLGMFGDKSGEVNEDYLDPAKNPMAFTPDYEPNLEASRYDNMMQAAAQARQYGLNDEQTREYLASNGLLPNQSDTNRLNWDSAADEMPRTSNPVLDWFTRMAVKSARPYVSPFMESRQQQQNLRNIIAPRQEPGLPINPNPVGDPNFIRRMRSSGF